MKSTMYMHKHRSEGSPVVDREKKALSSSFFSQKSMLQLRFYFHFNPKDLEAALEIPEVVECLRAGGRDAIRLIAIDNIICCDALINSKKFPELAEELFNTKLNHESLRKWPASPQPGSK